MLAVGVDLVEIARIEGMVSQFGGRFLDRIFTPDERAYCAGRAPALAARWAAKEAAAKALGTGIGAVAWHEIEITVEPGGRPVLRLHGRAAEIATLHGVSEMAVSLSHARDHAVACVVMH